jgi:hypothetical protein
MCGIWLGYDFREGGQGSPNPLDFYKLKWEGISLKYFIFFAGGCPPVGGKKALAGF